MTKQEIDELNKKYDNEQYERSKADARVSCLESKLEDYWRVIERLTNVLENIVEK